jgi:hypothetical protein
MTPDIEIIHSTYTPIGPWSGTAANYDVLVLLYPRSQAGHGDQWLRLAATPHPSLVNIGQMLDGTYRPRALSCRINESIGEELIPKIILPELTIEVARDTQNREARDLVVDRVNEYWGDVDGWVLRIYARERGERLDPLRHLIYDGLVARDGFEIDKGQVTFRADSLLAGFDIDFPYRTFADDLVSDVWMHQAYRHQLDPAIADKLMPIVYGDWSDPPSWYSLPGFIVNKLIGESVGDHRLKVCPCFANAHDAAFVGGRAWWQGAGGGNHSAPEWQGKFHVVNVTGPSYPTPDPDSYTNRAVTFQLDKSQGSDDVTWHKGDTVRLRDFQGNRGAGGALIEEPAAIIQNLLTDELFGAVSSELIDGSLDPADHRQFVTTGLRLRGWIGEKKKLITEIIAGICRDSGLIFYVKNGKFAVKKNPLFHWEYYGENVPVWRLDGVRTNDSQRHTLRSRDWDYHGVRIKYRRNPAADNYDKMIQRGDTRQIGFKTETIEPYLEIESDWLWRDEDARIMLDNYYLAIQAKCRVFEATAPLLGLGMSIGETPRLEWTGDGLEGAIIYITSTDKDYAAGAATVKGIRMVKRWYGSLWTDEDHPSFADSTSDERKAGGFWTRDDGLLEANGTNYDGFSHYRET